MAPSNYILFSDVHLGADLVQHVRPWTVSRLREVARVDRELSAMIDWYRERPEPGRPWKLVVAGDLVDFIGMSISATPDEEHELDAEERIHGLGSSKDRAAAKMRAVAHRHRPLFERLAAFVAEGHSLALVRGNHDVDFHWKPARSAFIEALVACRDELKSNPVARAQFVSRIEFHPWFFYVEGLLYVEHGHQFDEMCAHPHMLAPVSPVSSRRIHWTFSDLLLRQVVRPTRGLGSEGHDTTGIAHYVRLASSLGIRGALRLGYRYVTTIMNGLRVWRALVSDRAERIKRMHERRMRLLSLRTRFSLEKLTALSALWPRPTIYRGLAILRSVFADQLLLGAICAVLAALAWLVLPLIGAWSAVPWAAGITGGLAITLFLYAFFSGRVRRVELNPALALRKGAAKIAQLVEARFVVMGHTHEPVIERVSESSTYVNLGGWAVDDVEGPSSVEAPRTHFVIRFVDGELKAGLYRWLESGPEVVEDAL